MKKLFILSIAVIFTSACFGQKIYETQLPDLVAKAFKRKFIDAKDVKWEKEGRIYSAEFLLDESTTEVEFDTNGVWLSTEWEIPKEYTPQAIKSYIDTAYASYKFKELAYKDLPEDGKVYVAEVRKKKETVEVFFSLTGVFMRAVNEIDDKKKEKGD